VRWGKAELLWGDGRLGKVERAGGGGQESGGRHCALGEAGGVRAWDEKPPGLGMRGRRLCAVGCGQGLKGMVAGCAMALGSVHGWSMCVAQRADGTTV